MISRTDQKPEGEIKLNIVNPKAKKTRPAPPKELIPARYNSQTELKAEIPKGGKSDLKFDLTK